MSTVQRQTPDFLFLNFDPVIFHRLVGFSVLQSDAFHILSQVSNGPQSGQHYPVDHQWKHKSLFP